MQHLQGQPKGLYPLFFTELWERFGFYTIQTILVLYLSHVLGMSDKAAYLLYGAFTAMLYLTPVLGGYLADRYFGFKQAIILGGILFVFGYALMAAQTPWIFFLGMSLVIIANGFFKPNVSSIVGALYKQDDPRRDSGFTIFYMGINLGALFPPIFAGALVNSYGWNWGFWVASFGMIIGLATFLWFRRDFKEVGKVPAISPLHHGAQQKTAFYITLGVGIVVALGVLHVLFTYPNQTDVVLIAVSVAIIASVLYFFLRERPEQRRKLFACMILILISVGFWAIYMQTFTSIMLFADRNMEKSFLGLHIDAEFTQFFNPFFIILLSPFLSRIWVWLDHKKKNPSIPVKFSCGLLFMALGFLFLALGLDVSSDGMASPWWLVGSYFLQTIGELLLSPIGLAMITRLAPHHLVGMMMGVWFLTQSAAFAIGGALSIWASVPEGTGLVGSLAIYRHAFFVFGLISLALMIVSFLLVPLIKRLIANPTEPIPTPKA